MPAFLAPAGRNIYSYGITTRSSIGAGTRLWAGCSMEETFIGMARLLPFEPSGFGEL
jgi:hypothetical protein